MTDSLDVRCQWHELGVAARLDVVRRLRAAIAKDPVRFAASVARARKAAVAEAIAGEVMALADACRFLELYAEELLRPKKLGSAGRPFWLWGVDAEIRREPLGTILIVGPSNYPLYLPGVQILQALVAGNAVLVKPAPECAEPIRVLAAALTDSGLDARLCEVLPEDPASVDAAMERGIDKLVLTGSAATGQLLYSRAAEKLIPATMELSGWDASFVRHDADLDLTARALTFGLRFNAGETCIAPHRVFVAMGLARELEVKLATAVAALPSNAYRRGSLDTAHRLIDGAVRDGARIVAGGAPSAGVYKPTILADVKPSSEIMAGEVMAPLLILTSVANDDEALAHAARSPYALGATIFGKRAGALALAARVRAGSVVVNDVVVPTADPRLPFGGRGRSGFGATRGAEGLLEMTTIKTISHRKNRILTHMTPLTTADDAMMGSLVAAAHSSSILARGLAFLRVVMLGLARARSTRNVKASHA